MPDGAGRGRDRFIAGKRRRDHRGDAGALSVYKLGRGRLGSGSVSLESPEELLHYVSGEKEIYIFWDDASVPVVQTRLSCALNAFDDVAAIADTWLCDVDGQFIAEYTHDDELHLGFRTNEDRFSRFPAGAADVSPKTVSAQWRKVFGGGADDRFISRETAWRYAQLIYRGHPDQLEKAKEAIWGNQ